jgi:excisionase family DNA binding protein
MEQMTLNRPATPSRADREGDRIRRLLLRRAEAAAALGMSLDHFERYVQPHLGLVRVGKLRLVPVQELERWVETTRERV